MKHGRLFVFVLIIGVAIYAGWAALAPKSQPLDAACVDVKCLAGIAEENSQYVSKEQLPAFAANLSRAGRFVAANEALERFHESFSQSDQQSGLTWKNTRRAIVFDQFAATSWAKPEQIANYDALKDLSASSDWEREETSNYWLLAERMLEKFEPSLVSPELEKLLRTRVVRHGPNASLDELLHARWPNAIDKVPVKLQGTYWNYVAQVYTEMGNKEAAAHAIDKAEQSGEFDYQGVDRVYVTTTWRWLRLANYDRALKAARQVNPKETSAFLETKIAQALLADGQKEQAQKVLSEAAEALDGVPERNKQVELLIEIIEGDVDAGFPEDAKHLADKALEWARLPDLFPAAQLALAARGYNDIGDHARAVDLLHEAVQELPGQHKVIATGTTLGPISGDTMDVRNGILSSIVLEFYRAGDRKDFDEQREGLSSTYQTRVWTDLYTETRERHEDLPSAQDVYRVLPPSLRTSFMTGLAVTDIASGHSGEAKDFLQKVIRQYAKDQSIAGLLSTAQIAFAGDFSDLTLDALHQAADIAQKIGDKGNRAIECSAVAAMENELLSGD